MKSTKIEKNVICSRKYGKLIKQFATNLTSQVIPSSPTPFSVKLLLTQLWQHEYGCNVMS